MAKRAANPVPLEPPAMEIAGDALTRWIVGVLRRDQRESQGLGFDLAGVCRAEPVAHQREVLAWLAAGKHGAMDYLQKQIEPRLTPARELTGVKGVIMVGQIYQPAGREVVDSQIDRGEPTGLIARYAMQRDYHQSIKKRLHRLADALRARFPQEGFRTFVDTAPVLERQYASASGLGWHGKNTMIIHPHKGSYLVLGGMYTTLELPPSAELTDLEQPSLQQTDHCGTCTRCIDACPTQAISERSVDARVCISALTIERRSVIEPELASKIGPWIFGCDICQEVCPFNGAYRGKQADGDAVPSRLGRMDLLSMLDWREVDRANLGVNAMKRASLSMLRRNALIALVNHPRFEAEPAWRLRVKQIADDATEDKLVREQARVLLHDE